MNKTVIKELQKLMALCMEINAEKKHKASFSLNTTRKPSFDVTVWENGEIEEYAQKTLTCVASINLPNINKCRQKLLKYKEW